MTTINASGLDFMSLNRSVREADRDVEITSCLGQRFIAAGLNDRRISISGTPGNALGAYLNGAVVTVHGNAQDAVGDTMNEGSIVIHGNVGDAAGYAMRGGKFYVKGNAGYRAGIHMKEYKEKCPVMIIGGSCGSFLGEYQAGGLIVVLGIGVSGNIVSNFPCTGMHGGQMFLRSDCRGIRFPENVTASPATSADMQSIRGYVTEFCGLFGFDTESILHSCFTRIVPDSKNPYRQMYAAN